MLAVVALVGAGLFAGFWMHMLSLAATEEAASERVFWFAVVLLGLLPGAFLYSVSRLPYRDRARIIFLAKSGARSSR